MTELNLPLEAYDWDIDQWREFQREYTKRVIKNWEASPIKGAISFGMDEILKCHTKERFSELLDVKLAQLRASLLDQYEKER